MPHRDFTHLHVASWYSLRFGTAPPEELVRVAAGNGMRSLALTDRDGLYGAIGFVDACGRAGLAPVLGTDLALGPAPALGTVPAPGPGGPFPPPPRGGPGTRTRGVRGGGAGRDLPGAPGPASRVTVLALGSDPALDPGTGLPGGTGWTRLCRLVTDVRLHGRPVLPGLVAGHADAAGAPALAVLLGPDSEVGRAVLARRDDLALEALARWRRAVPAGGVFVEVVCHDGPPGTPASLGHASRLLALARRAGVRAVLTNAVRYPTRAGAVTADLLDAVRDRAGQATARRAGARADLVDGEGMAVLARRVARAAGEEDLACGLLRATGELAALCRIDGGRDLGLGSVHFPENHLLGPPSGRSPLRELRERCEAALPLRYPGLRGRALGVVTERLEDELDCVGAAGYAGYFLTVARICRMIRARGARVCARGSGAGSLVNHLLGISGVDPVRHDLLMERFVSPRRSDLPDIDLDVESDRRQEIQGAVLECFGPDRATCLRVVETYRARQAIRDAARALGIPGARAASIARSFPHLRARRIRSALAELPELRSWGVAGGGTDRLFDLAERLDGLPRHTALHPCGIVLSDGGLLDRAPLEAGGAATPMSQFGTHDVERLGLLKLDLLGNRMQSAMAHALREIVRVDGPGAADAGDHGPSAPYLCPDTGRIDLDAIPPDDPRTFRLIRSTRTVGCFQIESPGQRELLGRFAPETFDDLVLDISLFRPGPMACDMVTPFLRARRTGRGTPSLHPSLDPVLRPTYGVVLFHEQVLRMVAITSGCCLAEADEARRKLATERGRQEVHRWWWPLALSHGYDGASARRIWQVLVAFGAFGFCKAHAAAFAVPTYQSAWLKARHPAAFLAGVLTHDPGMYPRRLILQEARRSGVEILPLDVNRSRAAYRVERVGRDPAGDTAGSPRADGQLPGQGYGIRLSLSDVKGIRGEEVTRIVDRAPYTCLEDFRDRAAAPAPVTERLLLAGAFDALHGLHDPVPRPGGARLTRRDLLLHLRDLERRPPAASRRSAPPRQLSLDLPPSGHDPLPRPDPSPGPDPRVPSGPPVRPDRPLRPGPLPAGLPGTTPEELVLDQLEVLGLDACQHVLREYAPMLDDLRVTASDRLLERRNGTELLVAGARVAVQTPATRSGRRVVFLTLDDPTGPVDLAFFPDVQERCAGTVLTSWLLLARGVLRRSGPRGACLRATGAWDLVRLKGLYDRDGAAAVLRELVRPRDPAEPAGPCGAAGSRNDRCAPPGALRTPAPGRRGGRPGPGAAGPRGTGR